MTSISARDVEMMEEAEKTRSNWAEHLSPRILVKRPDVPGVRFNPDDANVLRTDDDRRAARAALDAMHNELRARGDQPPEWFEALP